MKPIDYNDIPDTGMDDDYWTGGTVGPVLEPPKDQEEEIKRLRQIIQEYARHNEGCSAAHGDQYRCRCGWREIEPEFH